VALILMDVKMPGMDGFETAELIRKRKRILHTPIIFLTASEGAEAQIFKGTSSGRWTTWSSRSCRRCCGRRWRYSWTSSQDRADRRQAEWMRRFEQREYERQLADAKARFEAERLREELRLAAEIQQKLFPGRPAPGPGLDIAWRVVPGRGDRRRLLRLHPNAGREPGGGHRRRVRTRVRPALVMAELRAYLRAFLLTRTDVGEIVRLLNHALAGDTDRFVTLFIAKIDPLTRSLV